MNTERKWTEDADALLDALRRFEARIVGMDAPQSRIKFKFRNPEHTLFGKTLCIQMVPGGPRRLVLRPSFENFVNDGSGTSEANARMLSRSNVAAVPIDGWSIVEKIAVGLSLHCLLEEAIIQANIIKQQLPKAIEAVESLLKREDW